MILPSMCTVCAKCKPVLSLTQRKVEGELFRGRTIGFVAKRISGGNTGAPAAGLRWHRFIEQREPLSLADLLRTTTDRRLGGQQNNTQEVSSNKREKADLAVWCDLGDPKVTGLTGSAGYLIERGLIVVVVEPLCVLVVGAALLALALLPLLSELSLVQLCSLLLLLLEEEPLLLELFLLLMDELGVEWLLLLHYQALG